MFSFVLVPSERSGVPAVITSYTYHKMSSQAQMQRFVPENQLIFLFRENKNTRDHRSINVKTVFYKVHSVHAFLMLSKHIEKHKHNHKQSFSISVKDKKFIYFIAEPEKWGPSVWRGRCSLLAGVTGERLS